MNENEDLRFPLLKQRFRCSLSATTDRVPCCALSTGMNEMRKVRSLFMQ